MPQPGAATASLARDLQQCITDLTARYHTAGGRRHKVLTITHPRLAERWTRYDEW